MKKKIAMRAGETDKAVSVKSDKVLDEIEKLKVSSEMDSIGDSGRPQAQTRVVLTPLHSTSFSVIVPITGVR